MKFRVGRRQCPSSLPHCQQPLITLAALSSLRRCFQGPKGHVLIDGDYPGAPPTIMVSIAKLGFDITDVKVFLNSHAHLNQAAGLAALQNATGAQAWISEGEAVREWEERLAPLLAEQLRCKRKGKVGRRWYVDETYLKIKANGLTCIVRSIVKAILSTPC